MTLENVAYTLLFTLTQGIVNIGSTTGGSCGKDGRDKERSGVVTTDRPESANLRTETVRKTRTLILVRGYGYHSKCCLVMSLTAKEKGELCV